MAVLLTGPIDNSPVNGVRPTQTVSIKIENQNTVNAATILIQGYSLTTSRILYVSEQFTILPGAVATRDYFANISSYEYVVTITGASPQDNLVSIWGKNSIGALVAAHRLVYSELFGSENSIELLERQERLAQQDLWVRQGSQALRALQVRRALLEIQERLERPADQVLPGLQAFPARQELRVQQELQALQE